MTKLIPLDLYRLKEFDISLNSRYNSNDDGSLTDNPNSKTIVPINLPFTDKFYGEIEVKLHELLKFAGISEYFDEFVAWYPSLAWLIYEGQLQYQLGKEAREQVETIIRIKKFQNVMQSDHSLTIRIENKSLKTRNQKSKLDLPNTTWIDSEVMYNITAELLADAIDRIVDNAVSIKEWLPKGPKTIASLETHLKTLPNVKPNPTPIYPVAYAVAKWVRYLNSINNLRSNDRYFSKQQGILIQNYFKIFQLYPANNRTEVEPLILEKDLGFNNLLRNAIREVHKVPSYF